MEAARSSAGASSGTRRGPTVLLAASTKTFVNSFGGAERQTRLHIAGAASRKGIATSPEATAAIVWATVHGTALIPPPPSSAATSSSELVGSALVTIWGGPPR